MKLPLHLLIFLVLIGAASALTLNDTVLRSDGLNTTINITSPWVMTAYTVDAAYIYLDALTCSDGSNQSINVTASDAYYVSRDELCDILNCSSFNSSQYSIDYASGLINFSYNGTYNVSYDFYPSTYVKDGTSRSMVNLVVLFSVFAVLAVSFGFWRLKKQ